MKNLGILGALLCLVIVTEYYEVKADMMESTLKRTKREASEPSMEKDEIEEDIVEDIVEFVFDRKSHSESDPSKIGDWGASNNGAKRKNGNKIDIGNDPSKIGDWGASNNGAKRKEANKIDIGNDASKIGDWGASNNGAKRKKANKIDIGNDPSKNGDWGASNNGAKKKKANKIDIGNDPGIGDWQTGGNTVPKPKVNIDIGGTPERAAKKQSTKEDKKAKLENLGKGYCRHLDGSPFGNIVFGYFPNDEDFCKTKCLEEPKCKALDFNLKDGFCHGFMNQGKTFHKVPDAGFHCWLKKAGMVESNSESTKREASERPIEEEEIEEDIEEFFLDRKDPGIGDWQTGGNKKKNKVEIDIGGFHNWAPKKQSTKENKKDPAIGDWQTGGNKEKNKVEIDIGGFPDRAAEKQSTKEDKKVKLEHLGIGYCRHVDGSPYGTLVFGYFPNNENVCKTKCLQEPKCKALDFNIKDGFCHGFTNQGKTFHVVPDAGFLCWLKKG